MEAAHGVSDVRNKSVPDHAHGTNGYANYGCRCEVCTTANTAAHRAASLSARSRPTPDHVHGTNNGYGYHGCRCGACRDAHYAYNQNYRRNSI